jgi:hypothetical protein
LWGYGVIDCALSPQLGDQGLNFSLAENSEMKNYYLLTHWQKPGT